MGFDFGSYVEPEGLSGGLALWWVNELKVDVECASKNAIHTVITEKGSNSRWAASFIYGCPSRHGREKVWDDIRDWAHIIGLPWLCMGDFNQVMSIEDKGGVIYLVIT